MIMSLMEVQERGFKRGILGEGVKDKMLITGQEAQDRTGVLGPLRSRRKLHGLASSMMTLT